MQRVASIRDLQDWFQGAGDEKQATAHAECFLHHFSRDGDYVPAMAHQVCAVLSTSFLMVSELLCEFLCFCRHAWSYYQYICVTKSISVKTNG